MWKRAELQWMLVAQVFHYTEPGVVPRGFFLKEDMEHYWMLLCLHGTSCCFGAISLGDYIVESELGVKICSERVLRKLFKVEGGEKNVQESETPQPK